LELGKPTLAAIHHRKDLDIAETYKVHTRTYTRTHAHTYTHTHTHTHTHRETKTGIHRDTDGQTERPWDFIYPQAGNSFSVLSLPDLY